MPRIAHELPSSIVQHALLGGYPDQSACEQLCAIEMSDKWASGAVVMALPVSNSHYEHRRQHSQVTLQTWPHMMSATWRHIHLHNRKQIASRNLFQRRTFTRHWQQDLQLRAAYRRALSCKGGCALGGSQVIEDALQDVEDDAAPREAGHKQATDQPSLPGEQTCRQPAIGEPRSASPCQAVILLTRYSSPDVEQTRDCTCRKGYRDAMYAQDVST